MAVITLAELKSHLGIDTSETGQDTWLTALITQTQSLIEESLVGRKFEPGQVTEYFSGDGFRKYLYVKHRPIRSSTTTFSSSDITVHDDPDLDFLDATKLVYNTDYVVWQEAGKIELLETLTSSKVIPGRRFETISFSRGVRNIKVVYYGGYAASTDFAVPDALKLAMLRAVSWAYGSAGMEGMSSSKSGPITRTQLIGPSGWPHDVVASFAPWRALGRVF